MLTYIIAVPNDKANERAKQVRNKTKRRVSIKPINSKQTGIYIGGSITEQLKSILRSS